MELFARLPRVDNPREHILVQAPSFAACFLRMHCPCLHIGILFGFQYTGLYELLSHQVTPHSHQSKIYKKTVHSHKQAGHYVNVVPSEEMIQYYKIQFMMRNFHETRLFQTFQNNH